MTDKPVYVERRPGDCAILRANSERTSDVFPTRKHDRKAAAIEAECEALERLSKAEDARWGETEREAGRPLCAGREIRRSAPCRRTDPPLPA
jgi:hypothetical protein